MLGVRHEPGRHLLLDFDGPICSIFAGLPAATVADRLRKLFGNHAQMPGDIASTPDPFEVFAYAATISADLAARVETEMTDLELAAVATAAPTPYVHEVVTACQNSGRSVAVVSNNSARAVHSYLARHGLDDRISLVVARTHHDPALLKPSPHLITQAVGALDAAGRAFGAPLTLETSASPAGLTARARPETRAVNLHRLPAAGSGSGRCGTSDSQLPGCPREVRRRCRQEHHRPPDSLRCEGTPHERNGAKADQDATRGNAHARERAEVAVLPWPPVSSIKRRAVGTPAFCTGFNKRLPFVTTFPQR